MKIDQYTFYKKHMKKVKRNRAIRKFLREVNPGDFAMAVATVITALAAVIAYSYLAYIG